MDTMNFSDMLPTANCPVNDAVKSLVENVPRFWSQWLFEVDAFVTAFRDRFVEIVNMLPQDDESRKELEIELAHIQHQLNTEYWLIIATTLSLATLRGMEEKLTEEGVLDMYRRFSEWVVQGTMTIDAEFFEIYLHYLYEYAQYDIGHVFTYLSTLRRFSQAEETDVNVILAHVSSIWDVYDQEQVDAMIDQHGYLWGLDNTYDDNVMYIMEEDPELTWQEANQYLDYSTDQNARIHIFLAQLWKDTIEPHYYNLDYSEQVLVAQLMNDLRDTLDPEYFIPLWFNTWNTIEKIMWDKSSEEWRTLH